MQYMQDTLNEKLVNLTHRYSETFRYYHHHSLAFLAFNVQRIASQLITDNMFGVQYDQYDLTEYSIALFTLSFLNNF